MKPKVEFLKLCGAKKQGKRYILIATDSNGKRIAFEVDGIK